jgi:hypothetical protein
MGILEPCQFQQNSLFPVDCRANTAESTYELNERCIWSSPLSTLEVDFVQSTSDLTVMLKMRGCLRPAHFRSVSSEQNKQWIRFEFIKCHGL